MIYFKTDIATKLLLYYNLTHGDVAQLGERSVRIREVESSILFVSTILTQKMCEKIFLL